ncbi:hypothetical protein BAUCODRAFT_226262 [Baudoinia panamericana UAMH 10762]|uniref:Uncharacterized protein n=1 Tax=Baudoinia panamericana (strain UAMH 10762) TaxID=717646 RepID=M2LJ35_BAUPA|nr:uncharacterized protein BAUCODRAFT_226262 [Baudoinia panamericana UAMH 10762]EMC94232.1 hypothetical protein BAUCODRAFT_226262 [Baudoinia panamericana UAMH 10762]
MMRRFRYRSAFVVRATDPIMVRLGTRMCCNPMCATWKVGEAEHRAHLDGGLPLLAYAATFEADNDFEMRPTIMEVSWSKSWGLLDLQRTNTLPGRCLEEAEFLRQ